MAVGDPGKAQFQDLKIEQRNPHIAAGINPLMLFRSELVNDNAMADRGGMDTPTRDHYVRLLVHADRWRRRLTHNPDKQPLGDKIEKAIDAKAEIQDADNPFGGDDIQMGSVPLYPLPWDFTGDDPNVPLNFQLEMPSQNAVILLNALDRTIVAWSRLNSGYRSAFITKEDSMRIYGLYQQILAYLMTFGGEENRVDLAQLPATDEPRGPENAPNRVTETVRTTTGSTTS